jgi:predicted kinase
MKGKVYIVRGLPGSGKSTKVKTLLGNKQYVICSADNFFVDSSGRYSFVPSLIKDAHKYCQERFLKAIRNNIPTIIVDNTNTQKWEYQYYLNLADQYDYDVEIIDLFDGGLSDEELAKRNIHNVPKEAISRMRARWEK